MYKEKYESKKNIGARVDFIRHGHSESRAKLASVVGVSASYMSRLLMDKVPWNEEMVAIVADHYQVSMEYILYGEDVIQKQISQGQNYDVLITDMILHLKNQPIEVQKRNGLRLMKSILEMIEHF